MNVVPIGMQRSSAGFPAPLVHRDAELPGILAGQRHPDHSDVASGAVGFPGTSANTDNFHVVTREDSVTSGSNLDGLLALLQTRGHAHQLGLMSPNRASSVEEPPEPPHSPSLSRSTIFHEQFSETSSHELRASDGNLASSLHDDMQLAVVGNETAFAQREVRLILEERSLLQFAEDQRLAGEVLDISPDSDVECLPTVWR